MLRSGNSGDETSNLQRLLKLKGFDPGGIDGVFGPRTEAALKVLQEAAGLDVDGIFGPKSEAALQGWAMGAGAPEAPEVVPDLTPDGPTAV